MNIRNLDYDNRTVMISQHVNGITELRRIDMKDFPLTLMGVFEAIGVETSLTDDMRAEVWSESFEPVLVESPCQTSASDSLRCDTVFYFWGRCWKKQHSAYDNHLES